MAIDFGKMIGPLPLGAWLVVVAGGGAVAYFTYQSTQGAPEETEDASGDEGVGLGGGQYEYTPPSPDSGGVAPKPSTNVEWGVQAITWLVAQGNPPGAATNAITKALAGGTGDNALTAQEYALWQLALKQFGPPPDPVTVPAPGTGGGTTPPPKPIPEGPTSPPKATSGFVQERLGAGVTRIRWNRVPWAAGYDVYLNNVWVVFRPRSLEYYAFKSPPLKKNVNYTIGVITRNVLNQKSPMAKFVFKIT